MVRPVPTDVPCSLRPVDREEMEEILAAIPDGPNMFVRGLFLDGNLKRVRREKGKDGVREVLRCLGDARLHLFGKYHLESAIRFQNEVSVLLFGIDQLHHGIRELARDYFSVMMESLAGRTLFGRAVAKRDVVRVFEKTRKASDTFAPYCKRDVVVTGENQLVFQMRRDYNYPREVGQGLLEGILEFLGKDGTVDGEQIGERDWNFHLTWSD